MNEIDKSVKEQYNKFLTQKLKPIIESIFLTNNNIYHTNIKGFDKEPHLRFSAKVFEDLLVPCPFVDVDTDDIDFINNRIRNEYKPVIVEGEIEYTEFQDWEDFISFKKDYVKKIFKKKLVLAQRENMIRLNDFTVGEIKIYFENHYGVNHPMTKKMTRYCLDINFDDKWLKATKSREIRCHRVEIRKQDGVITHISYKYYER